MPTQSDVPENAAEHCPGTQSVDAGKASSCSGCPNQNICLSGSAKTVDVGLQLVKERMESVFFKILVLSGKGGVGKSTVSALIARGLAYKHTDKLFGLLDIDICGPSQPRMFGVTDEPVHQSGYGWEPVSVDDNLSIMSIGFLLENSDQAVIWRGPKKNGMIRQFLSEVDWGQLDYLVVDSPPGTSDEHLSVVTYLNATKENQWGAVLVTTAQEISLLDVRKQINFCRKMKVPLIGVIENMTSYLCPKCDTKSEIFPANSGGVFKMCDEMKIPYLGSLPLDPKLTRSCDDGINFFIDHPNSKTVLELNNILDKIENFFH